MELICDTTPLIHLTKIGFHTHFDAFDFKLNSTSEIIKELKIENNKYPETVVLKKLVDERVLEIRDAQRLIPIIQGTSLGEISVISLALEMNAVAVIDDRLAVNYARGLGLTTVFTPFFIFRAMVKNAIDRDEARDYISKLIDSGWRCDVETYKNILAAIAKS